MDPDLIKQRITAALPDAQIVLEDLTGTRDHWKARIVSAAFTGKSLIARHRLVMGALVEEMKGPIHALTLDTLTPDEAATKR
ncbi:MAG TPA: BolA family transcriptional regulator [Kofleriaceae bacterium]|jgi:stress-induced morphogen|nr:BolA family transcriptional regulator [Kofleriaceae bacterium]